MQVSNIPTDHSSIIEGINEVYGLVTQTIQTVEVDLFNQPYGEKWSIAENVEHLIMSSFPVASGLKKNKFILKALGNPAAPELTYEALLQKYTLRISQAGVRATPKFTPESKVYDKDEILHNWKTIQNKFCPYYWKNQKTITTSKHKQQYIFFFTITQSFISSQC